MEITFFDYTFHLLWTALFVANLAAWALIAYQVFRRLRRGELKLDWNRIRRKNSAKSTPEAEAEPTPFPAAETPLPRGEKKPLEVAPEAKPAPMPASLPDTILPQKESAPKEEKPSKDMTAAAQPEKLPQGGTTSPAQLDLAALLGKEGLPPKPAPVAADKAADPQGPLAKIEKQGEVTVRKIDSLQEIFTAEQHEINSEVHALVMALEEVNSQDLLRQLKRLAHQLKAA